MFALRAKPIVRGSPLAIFTFGENAVGLDFLSFAENDDLNILPNEAL